MADDMDEGGTETTTDGGGPSPTIGSEGGENNLVPEKVEEDF